MRWSNLNGIGIPERKETKNKRGNIFENIIAKNFPKLMKASSHRMKRPKQTLNKKKRPNNKEPYILAEMAKESVNMLRPEKQKKKSTIVRADFSKR